MGLGNLVGRLRPAASRFVGWLLPAYTAALPLVVAADGWRSLHACAGHPCGIYQDTVLQSPLKSRPRINLGRAYFLKGRFDLALREYQQAELVAMEEREPAHTMGPLLAATNIADIFIHLNKWDEAHEILKEAWLKYPHFSGLALGLSLYYLTRTPPEPDKSDVFVNDAIAHMREFEFAGWELGKLYFNRAVAHGLRGECVRMKRDGWKAARLDPHLSVKDLHCFRN